ncbi:hypothetical protein RvY_03775-2 [Ramazzottius varieornatus]|uniref:Receptor ligand binding region domain-containing protein n=1 Tax=Ramazzottius varieornatus TaxID=947166 RepID=A0A1D1UYL9_RAMVA|nr:hypothetical protein RvY_03775-2 [Ramazzottius varieornatus]
MVALQGFRSLLKIQPCIQRPNNSQTLGLLNQFINYTKVNYNVTYEEPNEFVFTGFTAVLWLAQILHKAGTKEAHSGKLLASQFLNRSFSTPNTAHYYVDEQGERQNRMCIMTFNVASRSFEVP